MAWMPLHGGNRMPRPAAGVAAGPGWTLSAPAAPPDPGLTVNAYPDDPPSPKERPRHLCPLNPTTPSLHAAMGRPFKEYLAGTRVYSCANCRAHSCDHDDIVSKAFQGRHGRAYLFNNV